MQSERLGEVHDLAVEYATVEKLYQDRRDPAMRYRLTEIAAKGREWNALEMAYFCCCLVREYGELDHACCCAVLTVFTNRVRD